MTHTQPQPVPGPPTPDPDTVAVELVDGPQDGLVQNYTRQPGERMPAELDDHPGYTLQALDDRDWPPRWRYAWQHPVTGRRQPCRRHDCAPGCPNRPRPAEA